MEFVNDSTNYAGFLKHGDSELRLAKRKPSLPEGKGHRLDSGRVRQSFFGLSLIL